MLFNLLCFDGIVLMSKFVNNLINKTMNKEQKGNSIGLSELLTIAFIVLKLTNCIDWSWWWVLSPIWIPIAFILAFFIITFLCLTIKR